MCKPPETEGWGNAVLPFMTQPSKLLSVVLPVVVIRDDTICNREYLRI